MIPLIEDNRSAIIELCKQHGVRKLALFGSAATGTFDPATSDLDFFVDLDYRAGVGRRFMSFASSLERLLGARIDIVTERSITSEWFRKELDQTAVSIYEASDTQAIA
jgi:predicted nucleotidyltransferase